MNNKLLIQCLFLLKFSLFASPWNFISKQVLMLENGDTLKAGNFISPRIADYNNDGKKDLILGTFKDCKVFIYENIGTDAKPIFGSYAVLKQDNAWGEILDRTAW